MVMNKMTLLQISTQIVWIRNSLETSLLPIEE
jgi:hypothetical protein